jgi:hypothetical protein
MCFDFAASCIASTVRIHRGVPKRARFLGIVIDLSRIAVRPAPHHDTFSSDYSHTSIGRTRIGAG